jgi:predicted solute-binding protein
MQRLFRDICSKEMQIYSTKELSKNAQSFIFKNCPNVHQQANGQTNFGMSVQHGYISRTLYRVKEGRQETINDIISFIQSSRKKLIFRDKTQTNHCLRPGVGRDFFG